MFQKTEKNGLPVIEVFPNSFCTAAITTRAGGVSKDHLSSLNLGTKCGDSMENVTENLRRLGKALGFSYEKIVLTNQCHTKEVRRVYKEDAGVGITRPRFLEGVDALITNEENLPLLAYFADCVPVLFCDEKNRAVGVCHSGWRGTVGKIAGEVVLSMEKEFCTRAEDVCAVIGPHIRACCFEADAPVYEEFLKAFPKENGFAKAAGEKYHIDLSAAVRETLRAVGVTKIEEIGICTACESETFFSHRKTGGKRGCFGACIMINGR